MTMLYKRQGKTIGIVEDGILRKKIISPKQLLRIGGNTPAIDFALWESAKDGIRGIEARSAERTYYISRGNFDLHKRTIDFGFGLQYYVGSENWTIEERVKETKSTTLFTQ